MLPLAVVIAISIALSDASSQNCSALHSYVFIVTETDVGSTITTLTSSQALFPPHSYYIPSTPLITLSDDDDICHPSNVLSVDITDKVILLFETIGNCSIHYKVLRAQQHGAVAVLMSNDDRSGNVVNIPDDNSINDTSDTIIPMRSIGERDGESLKMFVDDPGHEITVSLGCYSDTSYASLLCLTYNPSTWGWYPISGEYQRQALLEFNKHPVWKLNGYPLYHDDLYLFLHDAEGDYDWFWAITSDDTFSNDSALVIRCSEGDIEHPQLCASWSEWNGTSHLNAEINTVPDITLTDDFCSPGNQTLCIDSKQSQLSLVKGTYSCIIQDEAEWFRDLNDCDQKGSILKFIMNGYYGDAYFALYELSTWTMTALCSVVLPDDFNDNGTYATTRYRPDLCSPWKLIDDTQQYTITDATLSVSLTECTDTTQCVFTQIPDTLCVYNSSVIYGSLMGEYIKLNETGPYYGSPVYERLPPDDAYWITQTLYIWHINEVASVWGFTDNIHYEGWILTDWSLERALEEGDYNLYGYCQGYAYGNPAKCIGWIFDTGLWQQYDENMIVLEDECTENIWPNMPDSWPEYVCIEDKDDNVFTGAYIKLQVDVDDALPAWIDIYNASLYLSTDEYNQWRISDTDITCDPYHQSDSLNPIDCKKWMRDVYVYDCSDAFNGVCLSKNGTMQSLLEGIYEPTQHYIDDYGTIEFENTNEYLQDIEGSVYLWYHESHWILSSVDFTTQKQADFDEGNGNVYGYCPGGETAKYSPMCTGCWVFYWDSSDKYIEDCAFTLNTDLSDCEGDIGYDNTVAYVQTLCVDDVSDGYIDVDDGIAAALGQYYYAYDDGIYLNTDESMYIGYDSIRNGWFIGEMYGHVLVFCNGNMISECVVWNDELSVNVYDVVSVSEECVSDVSVIQSTDNTDKVMGIVGGVFIAIFCIAVVVLIYCYYGMVDKYNKGYERRGSAAETDMIQDGQFMTVPTLQMISSASKDRVVDALNTESPDPDPDDDVVDQTNDAAILTLVNDAAILM